MNYVRVWVVKLWIGEGGVVENKGSEGMRAEIVGGVELGEVKEDPPEQVGKRNWSTVIIVFGNWYGRRIF